jgi:hypothetical protein
MTPDTTTDGATTATPESADTLDRPQFYGCVFCYAGQWLAYGLKRLRRAL